MGKRPRGPIDTSEYPTRFPWPQVREDVMTRFRQHYDEDTLPRGGRGIFYDLRPDGIHHPDRLTYRKRTAADAGVNLAAQGIITPEYVTDSVLSLLRRSGEIPEDWVADSKMPDPWRPSGWLNADTLAEFMFDHMSAARLKRQTGQPSYLAIWCEADDLRPRIQRIAWEYGVEVWSGGGSDGIKIKRMIAGEAANRDVPTIVGHIGDYDHAGEAIFAALTEDATAWFQSESSYWSPADLTFERLALTEDQALRFGLLDEKGKAEADGIPVQELDQIVRDFIEGYQTVTPPGEPEDKTLRADAVIRLEELLAE